MLRPVSRHAGYAIEASERPVGSVNAIPFDDATSKVGWLVVDTGYWPSGAVMDGDHVA